MSPTAYGQAPNGDFPDTHIGFVNHRGNLEVYDISRQATEWIESDTFVELDKQL